MREKRKERRGRREVRCHLPSPKHLLPMLLPTSARFATNSHHLYHQITPTHHDYAVVFSCYPASCCHRNCPPPLSRQIHCSALPSFSLPHTLKCNPNLSPNPLTVLDPRKPIFHPFSFLFKLPFSFKKYVDHILLKNFSSFLYFLCSKNCFSQPISFFSPFIF